MKNNDTYLGLRCKRSIHTDVPSLIFVNTSNINVIDRTFRTIVMTDGSYWILEKKSMDILIKTLNIDSIDFESVKDFIKED